MSWEPWDGSTLAEAMGRADALLYHDKRARKASMADETSEIHVMPPLPPEG